MLFSALFRRHIAKCSDAELVELVRKQNRNAQGELFKRYSALVMGVCLKYVKDYAKAEDIMMSLFERIPDKIANHSIQNFKSWLHSVARNECLMELRKKNKLSGEINATLLATEDESEYNLKLALLKNKKLDLLEEALEQLKPLQRNALFHFYLEKRSYDQVADLMNISLKKVKSLIQNGKRNLKLTLDREDAFK